MQLSSVMLNLISVQRDSFVCYVSYNVSVSACVWILKVERVPGSSSVGEKILYELESTVNNVCQL